MHVGIIGAGLSGLVAGRELLDRGHEVTIVEKSRGVGGRIAARRVEDTVVDHGAPYLAADPGGALAAIVERYADADLVRLDGGVAYRSGATHLAKLLAEELTIIRGTRIAALRRTSAGFELAGEQGNTHGTVDRVIVTAPAPQAADLLETSGLDPERVAALRAVAYDPAVMILAGYRIPPPGTLVFDAAAPFTLVTNETAKGRPPVDGVVPVVARLDPASSARCLDASDADILALALPALAKVVGAPTEPAWVQVKRWRFASPVTPADPARLNARPEGVILAGDSLADGFDAVVASALEGVRLACS